MNPVYDVYGVGHALVDVQYRVTTDDLDRLGVEKGVMTLIDADRLRQLVGGLATKPVLSTSGGSAANTMIAIARFGGLPYFACHVGSDEWGEFYLRDLRAAGTLTQSVRSPYGQTGQCLVLITPDADRTLNTCLGVSSDIDAISDVETDVVAGARYVYLEGYLVSSDNGFAACRRAQALACQHSIPVSLTLSDPLVVSSFRERFEVLVEGGIDLLFCNEDEAKTYTGCTDRLAAARTLGVSIAQVCVTCGGNGSLLVQEDRQEHIAALPITAIDTTGAGDMFAGGTLYGLTHDYDLSTAAKLGTYAAAEVVRRFGPRLEHSLVGKIDAILDHFIQL